MLSALEDILPTSAVNNCTSCKGVRAWIANTFILLWGDVQTRFENIPKSILSSQMIQNAKKPYELSQNRNVPLVTTRSVTTPCDPLRNWSKIVVFLFFKSSRFEVAF